MLTRLDGSQLEVFKNGVSVRVVQTSRETRRWTYFARGNRLPFEMPDYETRKEISTRLNRDVLVEYLRSLGVDFEGLPAVEITEGFILTT